MNTLSYILGSILAGSSLLAGLLLMFFPPKKINAWYGLSTKSTRKNQKSWNFGHKICAIALLVYAFFSILAYVLTLLLVRDFLDEYWYFRIVFGFVYALVAALIGWAVTEMELARLGKKTKKEKQEKPAKNPKSAKESKPAKEKVPTAEIVIDNTAEISIEPTTEVVVENVAEPASETIITEIVTEIVGADTTAEMATEAATEVVEQADKTITEGTGVSAEIKTPAEKTE